MPIVYTDNFSVRAHGVTGPAENAVAVTPHDTNDLVNATRGIYVGVTGDIVVNMLGTGAQVTFKAVPVGVLPIRVTRIYLTNTTATNLLALS